MLGRNIRKKPAHNGTQTARDPLNKAGPFGQTHHSQPQCHDPDEPQRNRDGGFRAIERALGYLFKPIVPAANRNREQHQRKPDVIQHA
jgi:hypothetical protein